jgi:hydroxycarboxylate dehydrogenase B
MKTLSAPELQRIGVQLFTACGSPPDEAAAVTDELVESSLMGLDSHGVIRFPEYVDLALSGAVKTGTPTHVLRESGATALARSPPGA